MLHGHVPSAVARSSPAGRLPGSTQLNLAIGLPLRNQASLTGLLHQIYDPASPRYHQYLTPEEFAQRFGPTEADYQALIAFAKAHGLAVTATHPNRALLDVSGSVEAIEQVFHINLHLYQHPTEDRTFYAPDREPSLDLAVPLLRISGLDNYSLPRPRVKATPLAQTQSVAPNAGSGPGGTYRGNDFRAAYLPDSTLTGSGQIVGLLQFDGYRASDVTYYEGQAGLPNVPLSNVLLDGFSGTPTGSGGEVEVSLDIEMVISMAPSVSQIIVYEAGPFGNWHDILNRMATDNLAKQLSCSWYSPGAGPDSVADQIFQQMAAQGQSFFNASGDYDAYTGPISFPGETPYLTQVGGTTLTTSGPGGVWVSETVWNWGGGVGSAGGISTSYPIPSWQTNIVMTSSQGSTTKRNTPDVALTADKVYVRANGRDYNVGGTSCAAPLWAGFAALVNQQAVAAGRATVGFINTAVYDLGSKSLYPSAFHDITTGNNTKSSSPTRFYAVTGYDLCTGWGTPAGQSLITALATPDPLQITPGTGFAALGKAGGPFNTTSQAYSLTNVGAGSLDWTLVNTSVWLNASQTGGTLTPGGPAATVTLGLNSTASNLVVGIYDSTVWFTNLNDSVGQSLHFSLAVLTPPAITAPPSDQAVLGGATATFRVGAIGSPPLAYRWQDNGTNLSDGGNISGSATTNVTVSSVSPADVGSYSMVVSNAVGVVTSPVAHLSITPSPPVIVVQPTDQTVFVGRPVSFSVRAVGSPPFSYQWMVNSTNIAGATDATLAFEYAEFNDAGTYAVQVTNALGPALSSNAVLTVVPPPPCAPVESGLVSWWAAEGNANDLAGTNNGSPTGGISYTNGEVNQAFVFDGANTYIPVPASPSLDIGNGSGVTIECWVKGAGNSIEGPIVEWDSATTDGLQLWPGGNLYANLKDEFGTDHQIESANGLLGTDDFQHVALTYDKGSGLAFLYINGSQVATQDFGTIIPQTSYPAYHLNIGRRTGQPIGLNDTYNGLLDELSVYNRGLTAEEILTIYEAGMGGKCPPPPTIFVQPASRVTVAGATVAFAVMAGGTPPLTYQWSFNGTNITGATYTSLTLTNVQLSQAGTYAVQVTNFYGSALSSNAVLTVGIPPVISTQPTNETVNAGSTATFAVVASSAAPLSYQWSFNATNIIGETSATLTVTNAQLANEGSYSVALSNVFGATLSSNAVLTVVTPPAIASQPASQTGYFGGTATFSVTATGSSPLIYQWRFNDTNLAGATNPSLTLTNIQFSQAGSYAVLVTNSFGSVLSSNAVLTVVPPPPCAPVPSGLVGWWQAEGNTTNSVGTNNGSPTGGISYTNGEVGQAFVFNGSTSYIPVPASSNLDIGAGSGVSIECWVDGAGGSTEGPIVEWDSSSTDGLQLWPGGNLYANIKDTAGGDHQIQSAGGALATNSFQHVALTYDKSSGLAFLYINGSQVATQSFGNITPQTSYPAYHLNIGRRTGQQIGLNSTYNGLLDELSIYNRGLTQSEIQAIYNAGTNGKCPLPPVILSQPLSHQVAQGNTVTFFVRAGGSQPLSYQWSFNSTNLTGKTNASLTLTNAQLSQLGIYTVLVSNVAGSILSSNAVLSLGLPPAITIQPSNQTANAGATVAFMVVASSSVQVSYQWSLNATNITGGSNATFTIANAQLSNAGSYRVKVSNIFGSVFSSNAMLTVIVPPIISAQPVAQTVLLGGTANFSVIATGSLPLSYQWRFKDRSLARATNFSLVLTNIQSSQAGNYAVLVTNAFGSALSSNAMLTVNAPPPCAPVPSGLVSWWAAEGNANDQAGTNNGSPTGGITYTNGERGQAFVFNGSTSYIPVPASPGLDIGTGSGVTVECWVKGAGSSIEGPIVEWDSSSTDGLQLWPGATLYANIKDTSGNDHAIESAYGTLSTDVFQHVALTYDKSSGAAFLYINGSQVASQNFGSITPQTSYPDYQLNIGRRTGQPNGLNDTYNGLLDELSIYNRALTDAEISAIYNAGAGGKCPPAAPTILTQPTSQSVLPGCNVFFTVVASGSDPLSYQWWKDGLALDGQTDISLSLNDVHPADFGSYRVVITNVYGAVTSSAAALSLDHAPIAALDTIRRYASGGVRVKAAELLKNDTDADGDVLTVSDVSSVSSAGGTVALNGDWIYYDPPGGFTNTDTFGYTVSDGHCGGSDIGFVTVALKPDSSQPSNFTIENRGDGSFRLTFDGVPGWTYRIQTTDSLPSTNWQDVDTQTADEWGVYEYIDWPPTDAPARYYRAVTR